MSFSPSSESGQSDNEEVSTNWPPADSTDKDAKKALEEAKARLTR